MTSFNPTIEIVLIGSNIEMTDEDDKLKEKLWEKVMERMPPGGTRKDVRKILENLILDDDGDVDEGEEEAWIYKR